jgi:hypothetical protein
MRKSIRFTGAALLAAALVAAGPASARDRYDNHYRGGHGHGGNGAGVALAVGALVGLAVGAAVLSSGPAVAAPVDGPGPGYAPAPVYVEQPRPVAYAQPQVPPGYCYSDYNRAYVPCGSQPVAPVRYYEPPQPAYSY